MSGTPAPPVKTKPYKAIAAFILTFAGLVIQAMTSGPDKPVTVQEWVVIVVGALITTAAVYGITNPATKPVGRDSGWNGT